MNRSENAAHISRLTAKQRGESLVRHGSARRGAITPEHKIWTSMRQRCENPNAVGYENYGGRGITVCNRWQSFANFITDMGERPSPAYSLERVDNDKGYSPDNCKWATRVEQKANQRPRKDAIWIYYEGERKTLDDWARLKGMKYSTLRARLQNGWAIAKALTTPTRSYT